MYKAAHAYWNATKSIWPRLFGVLAIGIVINLLVVRTSDLSKTLLATIFSWFALFGPVQVVLLSLFTMLVVLIPVARTIIIVEKCTQRGEVLKKYLRQTRYGNEKLGLTDNDELPPGFISVPVPLEDNFIHLRAVPDRPRFEIPPEEQQRQIDELSDRLELDIEEIQNQLQLMRSVWQFMQEEQTLEDMQSRAVSIEKILEMCTATNPVAIILGAPGSGKSTCLRWLALHMSQSLLEQHKIYNIPQKLDRAIR